MECVECMGVASRCGEQEVGVAIGSGWHLWVWLVGVVVRRYIDILILLTPTPLVSVLFATASLLFIHLKKKVFRSYSSILNYILKYVLNNFLTQYNRRLRASRGSHMKAAHNVLYTKKRTLHILRWTSAV